MTRHEHLSEETRELVALYALGMLESGEADHLRAHLNECPQCHAELRDLEFVTGQLAYVSDVAPPARLSDRLLDRIEAEAGPPPAAGAQVWKRWDPQAASPPMATVRAEEGSWEETDIEGIRVRRLFVDRARQSATMIVRMDPGARYPGHRHGGAEECYVVDGDLHVGDRRLQAGDYHRAELDSVHPVQWTESGCMLFIVSSLDDELLR